MEAKLPQIKLLAGLGNPGSKYAETRHNVGFQFADTLVSRLGNQAWERKKDLELSSLEIAGQKLFVVKPISYMNLSGKPLSAFMRFYKFSPEQLVVVHDDLDLPLANIRLRLGGGDAGHRGLSSIKQCLGTANYYRIKLGIDRPPEAKEAKSQEQKDSLISNWVLGKFSTAEKRLLDQSIDQAIKMLELLMSEGLVAAQNSFNKKVNL